MGVLSKLQSAGLKKVVDEIMKLQNPENARVIRITKDGWSVFENTEKAAKFLIKMFREFTGHRYTVSLEAMIDTLNDSEKISENNKKYVLNDVLDVEVIV